MRYLLLIFLLTLSSCASYLYDGNFEKVNSKNYHIFGGNYENAPFIRITDKNQMSDISGNQVACLRDYITLKDEVYLEACDTQKLVHLKIEKKEKDYFLVMNYENSEGKSLEYWLKGKFSSGFFRLYGSRQSDMRGIPYIFGGVNVSDIKLGLDKDRNLIIERYWDNSGAFLFVFWAGNSGTSAIKFKRQLK